MDRSVFIATSYAIIFENLYNELSDHGFHVVGLITRTNPDPSLLESALAKGLGGCVFELPWKLGEMSIPASMKNDAVFQTEVLSVISRIKTIEFEYLISWGINVLPPELLALPSKLPINVHPSDLPKYRGGFPFQAQILNNEIETKVTIHKTTNIIDKGDIYAKSEAIPIETDDSMTSMVAKVVPVGAKCLATTLASISEGTNVPIEIEEDLMAPDAWGIKRDTASVASGCFGSNAGILGYVHIQWQIDDVDTIRKSCRAFDMMGGPYASIDGQAIRILSADVVSDEVRNLPGMIYSWVDNKIVVQAIDGIVRLTVEAKHRFCSIPGGKLPKELRFDNSVSIETVTGFKNSDRFVSNEWR